MTTLAEKLKETLNADLQQLYLDISTPGKSDKEREHLSGRIRQIDLTLGELAELQKRQMQDDDVQPPGPGEQPQKKVSSNRRARPWGSK